MIGALMNNILSARFDLSGFSYANEEKKGVSGLGRVQFMGSLCSLA
jgi:hypothetical protein